MKRPTTKPHQRHLHLVLPSGIEDPAPVRPTAGPRTGPDDNLEFLLRESIRQLQAKKVEGRKRQRRTTSVGRRQRSKRQGKKRS